MVDWKKFNKLTVQNRVLTASIRKLYIFGWKLVDQVAFYFT